MNTYYFKTSCYWTCDEPLGSETSFFKVMANNLDEAHMKVQSFISYKYLRITQITKEKFQNAKENTTCYFIY